MVTAAVERCMKHASEMTVIFQSSAGGVSMLVEYTVTIPHIPLQSNLFISDTEGTGISVCIIGVRFREVGFLWISSPQGPEVNCL